MLDWPWLIRLSPEEQFKVGIKATLILDSRLCGSLRSPRDVVYSAMFCSILPSTASFPAFSWISCAVIEEKTIIYKQINSHTTIQI